MAVVGGRNGPQGWWFGGIDAEAELGVLTSLAPVRGVDWTLAVLRRLLEDLGKPPPPGPARNG